MLDISRTYDVFSSVLSRTHPYQLPLDRHDDAVELATTVQLRADVVVHVEASGCLLTHRVSVSICATTRGTGSQPLPYEPRPAHGLHDCIALGVSPRLMPRRGHCCSCREAALPVLPRCGAAADAAKRPTAAGRVHLQVMDLSGVMEVMRHSPDCAAATMRTVTW